MTEDALLLWQIIVMVGAISSTEFSFFAFLYAVKTYYRV